MKNITKLLKMHDFKTLYELLKNNEYRYSLEGFDRDFKKNISSDKFSYLVYLNAREKSVKNILLLCDFLLYTDTFFYDIHPVIYDYLHQGLSMFPTDKQLLNWIISVYENHPDSPFDSSEIEKIKLAFKNNN